MNAIRSSQRRMPQEQLLDEVSQTAQLGQSRQVSQLGLNPCQSPFCERMIRNRVTGVNHSFRRI